MSLAGEPYLSLVVTARNDDHGGNLLGRMQAFVNGWIGQANRYQIPSELIIVEWNPPAGRPPLRDVLHWPADLGPCRVRFIEVPPELHRRFAHAEALPLYQMIGKNVGIRRARGQFVLATNIDILFSSELAAFFAERRLESGRMYRIDRHDVMSEVPVDGSVEEQLAYCRTHMIRVNAREGSFPVTHEGRRMLAQEDPVSSGSGILFGRGWYAVEKYAGQPPFRWAGACAELLLEEGPPAPSGAVLKMDIEPGPGTGGRPLQLEVTGENGQRLADVEIGWRCRFRLPLAAPAPRRILFETRNGGLSAGEDPRVLNFRIFHIEYASCAKPGSVELRPIGWLARLKIFVGMLDHAIEKLATGGDRVALTVPVSTRMRNLFRRYLKIRPVSVASPSTQPPPLTPLFLHTNACGDFTLMARKHWFDLRAYPEFDLFSMNLDSVFCVTAHHGGARETILSDPMRIYHIEHGTGSGWTPEGQAGLFARLAAGNIPHLENDEVLRWAAQMRRLNSPMIFNHENWGMADLDLKETDLCGRERP